MKELGSFLEVIWRTDIKKKKNSATNKRNGWTLAKKWYNTITKIPKMWIQNSLTISITFFSGGFWNRGEVGGWNSQSTAVQSQKPLLWCFAVLPSGWAVVGTFLGEARLSATANLIFRRLEVTESVFLVSERIVFMNIEKKKSVWSVSMTKKVGKMGGLLKIFKGVMVFLFCYTCPIFSE